MFRSTSLINLNTTPLEFNAHPMLSYDQLPILALDEEYLPDKRELLLFTPLTDASPLRAGLSP
jgi:hypothetical protein